MSSVTTALTASQQQTGGKGQGLKRWWEEAHEEPHGVVQSWWEEPRAVAGRVKEPHHSHGWAVAGFFFGHRRSCPWLLGGPPPRRRSSWDDDTPMASLQPPYPLRRRILLHALWPKVTRLPNAHRFGTRTNSAARVGGSAVQQQLSRRAQAFVPVPIRSGAPPPSAPLFFFFLATRPPPLLHSIFTAELTPGNVCLSLTSGV